MAGMHARSRGWSAAGSLVLSLFAAAAWPRSATAQTTGCDFPVPWANARSWTGLINSTATGEGALPPNGSYSITQTITGTVTLDHHIPLENAFTGSAKFTVSAHEHIELPNPDGPPDVFDMVANQSFDEGNPDDFAGLAFDFKACTYYFYIEPRGLAGTLNGLPNGYVLGPEAATPVPDLLDANYFPLPTGSLPDLSTGAAFQAPTMFSTAFSAIPPVDWTVTIDLTPQPCAILDVPLLKQGAPPWAWDTYDKDFDTRLILLPTITKVASDAGMELLEFPIHTSQGNPGAANHIPIPLSGSDNNLVGLGRTLQDSATVEGPNGDHPSGTLLRLKSRPLNSMQLLSTPGDPTSNFFVRIADAGCFMTCATMILDYYGGSANPRTINDWLNDQVDGFLGHNVNSHAVERYASEQGVTMKYINASNQNDDATVEKYICSGNPVMLKVNPCTKAQPCQHWAVATGKTVANGELTWTINDPGFLKTNLGQYGGAYSGYRLWTGPRGAPAGVVRRQVDVAAADQSRLILAASPSFQLSVTDPAGRQLQCAAGFSVPVANPIPDANCTMEALQNDTDVSDLDSTPPTIIVEASGPSSGDWHVDVATIDTRDYTVDALAYDSDGGVSRGSATGTGPAVGARYTIAYSSVPGTAVVITGPPVADGGTSADAGSPPDAGVAAPDGGATGTGGGTASGGSHSGGCGTGDPGALGALALLGVLAARRKRGAHLG